MNEAQESTTNHKQGQLSELLAGLSIDQIRFITARLECATDKEAAKKVGISPITVAKWPNRDQLDQVMRQWLQEPIETAVGVLQRNVLKAIMVKVAGLDSKSESIRQAAATEIIDRVIGKPTQPITGKDGQPLFTTYSDTEFVSGLAALLATIGARAASGDVAGLEVPLEPASPPEPVAPRR